MPWVMLLVSGCYVPNRGTPERPPNQGGVDPRVRMLELGKEAVVNGNQIEKNRLRLAISETETQLMRHREAKQKAESELLSLMERDTKSPTDLLRIDDLKLERRSLMENEPRIVSEIYSLKSKLLEAEAETGRIGRHWDDLIKSESQRLKSPTTPVLPAPPDPPPPSS
jgi:hypothetical protein